MGSGRFENKVALVTGGTAGIGAAVVRALAQEGAKVVFCGLLDGLGDALEEDLCAAGADARFVHADVREDGEIERLVAACTERHGRLDLAVNNAGISHPPTRLADLDCAHYADVMRTNADGVFFAMRHEIPAMLAAGGGAIVNIASILSTKGAAWVSAYGASKHAVVGLTKSAALEYAADNLRVNAVSPGPVDTPMLKRALIECAGDTSKFAGGFPPAGPGAPGDVADAVLYLLSENARFITGANMIVDGGTTAG